MRVTLLFLASLISLSVHAADGRKFGADQNVSTEVDLAQVISPAFAAANNNAARRCASELSGWQLPVGNAYILKNGVIAEEFTRMDVSQRLGWKLVCALALSDAAQAIHEKIQLKPTISQEEAQQLAFSYFTESFHLNTKAVLERFDRAGFDVLCERCADRADRAGGSGYGIAFPLGVLVGENGGASMPYQVNSPGFINPGTHKDGPTYTGSQQSLQGMAMAPYKSIIVGGSLVEYQMVGGGFAASVRPGELVLLTMNNRPWFGGSSGLFNGKQMKVSFSTKGSTTFSAKQGAAQ